MQSDPRNDDAELISKRGEGSSEPQPDSPDDEMSAEEWAELERATAPNSAPLGQSSSGNPGVVDSEDMVADRPVTDHAGELPDELAIAQTIIAAVTPSIDQPIDTEPPQTEPPQTERSQHTTDRDNAGWVDSARDAEHRAGEVRGEPAEGDDSEPNVDIAAHDDTSDEDDTAGSDDVAVADERLAMPLPRIIAVANQKGGVGKTTTTVNIAACLAEQGYRTLLVDLDPQANASTGVGLEPRELEHSIYHVMLHDQPADSCIEPTEIKNLFVLPSSLDLAGAEIELVSLLSREHRLRMAIDTVIDDYDYVLIDCPPSLGLLTINALTAAREVLVPIQCEYYALEGLGQLIRNVDLVRASLNPTLQISHIVLVMFDPRTKLAGQVVDEVRAHFGATVCDNVIPRTVRLSEAPSFGQPITTFDTDSRGAAAYRAVTQEVLDGQA